MSTIVESSEKIEKHSIVSGGRSNESEVPRTTISEGKAEIIKFSQGVFYNPVQEFNRDLSVAAISVFSLERQNKKIAEKEKNVTKKESKNKKDIAKKFVCDHGYKYLCIYCTLRRQLDKQNFFKRPDFSTYVFKFLDMETKTTAKENPQSSTNEVSRTIKIVVKIAKRDQIYFKNNKMEISERKTESKEEGGTDNVEAVPTTAENLEENANGEGNTEEHLQNILALSIYHDGVGEGVQMVRGPFISLFSSVGNVKNIESQPSLTKIEKNSENSNENPCNFKEKDNTNGIPVQDFQTVPDLNGRVIRCEFTRNYTQPLSEEIEELISIGDLGFHNCTFPLVTDEMKRIWKLARKRGRFRHEKEEEEEVDEGVEGQPGEKQSPSSEEKRNCNGGITILEALSATGLRSIRYAKEVPGVKQIFANDLSFNAVEAIKQNVSFNEVNELITAINLDATNFKFRNLGGKYGMSISPQFDVIDLDPYGSATPFLPEAMKYLADGGLLLVTCTDMAVLAGNVPESCFIKYGSIPLRSTACHEMALRIVLNAIQNDAFEYNKYIVPLLSISADFYLRVFVRVYKADKSDQKSMMTKRSYVYQCVGCNTLTLGGELKGVTFMHGLGRTYVGDMPQSKSLCDHCGHKHSCGGPIWSYPIHDLEFVEKMLSYIKTQNFGTMKRMEGMLELILEELQDVPLYYTVESLCSKVHCEVLPQVIFHSALLNAGYRVTLSHCAPNSLKTDAPPEVIWDILRRWVESHPVSKKRRTEGSVTFNILNKEPSTVADFTMHPKAISRSKMNKLVRYQQNPQPYWGPGCRNRTNYPSEEMKNKRKRNQNKKKNKRKAVTDASGTLIIKSTGSDSEEEDSNNGIV